MLKDSINLLVYLSKRITKSHLNVQQAVRVKPSEVPNSVMEALFTTSKGAQKVSDKEITELLSRPTLADYTLKGKIKKWIEYYRNVSSISESKVRHIDRTALPADVEKALFPELPDAEIKRLIYVS